MEEAMAEANFMYRIFSSLFSIFGASALFLAAVGLYGVIDFSVSNRVREMGVRVALGASRADVVRLVLGKVLAQLALGAALGVGLGFALAVPLSSTLFGVETFDPLVYGVIVGTLFLTGVVAALVPIRRALAVDPGVALTAA
jgi:ABC-type antimicrobial peptide transport system permease subunit